MSYTLKEIAEAISAEVRGDDLLEVTGVASLESAKPNLIVFVEDAKLLEQALASKAGAIVTSANVANGAVAEKSFLIASQPKLAFARAAAMLAEPVPAQLGTHPSAIVHGDARLGLGVSVGALTVIERGASLGARTRVATGCFIGERVVIGEDCHVGARVTILAGTSVGNRVVVKPGAVLGTSGFGFVRDEKDGHYEKFPQQGTLEVGDDVEIGANCTLDRGALGATSIGRGTKLDNMVHVGHNVRIGAKVVIAAQTGVSGSSVIGDGCIIGGQVGIADHVTIEEGVIVGAQAGIPSGKVLRGKGTVYWGTPARPIKQLLKEMAALARSAKGK